MSARFAAISGEMAGRIRALDWSKSPLGALDGWTPALVNAVSLMLPTQAQIVMFWGPDYVALYNDAYIPTIGDKHPRALGRPARENWSELWDDLEPLLRGVRETGETFSARDRPFYIERDKGKGETVYFDISYSAVRESSGAVGGVLCIVSETTQRVRAQQKAVADRERFAEMFRQAPSFMAQLDGPQHVFTLANDAYQQLIGHRDVTGKTIREALPELAGQGFYELLDQVYRSGAPYVGRAAPVALQRTNGAPLEDRVLDFVYQPIKAADGSVTGIFVEGFDVSDAQRARNALEESEQRFHGIADATPVLIWIADTTKACTWFNKTWLDFTGRTMEQEFGDGWAEGVHPEDYERCLATYVEAFDRRAPFRMLYRLRRHDGQWRMIDDNGVPRFADNGVFMGYIGSCIDVTDQHAAESALRRSEEQLRLATENAGIGLWDIDRDGGIALSYSRDSSPFIMPQDRRTPMEDFLGQIHPDDSGRVRTAYNAARDPKGRPMMDVEYRILPSDGSPMRWVKVRGRGVFDAQGNCLRVSGTALDITRERETQEALARSEEMLRLASDNAEVGMWDMDVLHNIALSTPRVKAMFGMPEDSDPAPDEFFALVHPQDIARVQKAYAAAFDPAGRAAYDIEYRVTGRDDGVERWIHAKGRGVFDAGGTLLRVTGTAIDITARKTIEREIHELNETLEKRVAERTAALEKTQAALQQAQKMEAIGNLTGGIAHDFNNLLQGLTGSLDLIRNKPQDTERVRRWAEAGLQAAERGAKLTAQLLAFSRAQKLELKPLALNRLLEEMRDLLGRTLGPPVQVTLDLAGDVGSVLGDETQLEMSVLNLAINARDAMPGGGTLTIVTRALTVVSDPQLQPGEYVELRVSDSGTGMPADIIARAFDPFFTTKGVGKGTGLGLSQVYGMAQQAGGTARIGSEPGKGTAVSIFLRATAGEAARETRMSDNAVKHAGHTATVLVIDDDPDVRAFLVESLEAFGYAVNEAKDGPHGLEMIAKHKPDIVLVDYAMPGMTGAEVAARVRKAHGAMPIIFASGYAETAALESVLDENTAILRKPFRLGELQEAVANALRGRSPV